MKKNEIKEELIKALEKYLDPDMSESDFKRTAKSLRYIRTIGNIKQEFLIEFASNPSYSPGALAHITPILRINNSEISDLALRLVKDPWLLANAPELIASQGLTMVPTPQRDEWYIGSLEDLPNTLCEIKNEFIKWGLPFLSDYSTPEGIIAQYNANDSRRLKSKSWYIFVLASFLLTDQDKEAMDLFDIEFNKPGILKQYKNLKKNIKAELRQA